MNKRAMAAGICAFLSAAWPLAAAAQGSTQDDFAALIAKLDSVIAAGITPEATAALLGASLAAPVRPETTSLSETRFGPYRLSDLTIAYGPSGAPRLGFEVGGPCVSAQDGAALFPIAQWTPYSDRDPAKFSQLVETRAGATIKLTFRLGDGCLAAISAESAPLG